MIRKLDSVTICSDLTNDFKGVIALIYSLKIYCDIELINIIYIKSNINYGNLEEVINLIEILKFKYKTYSLGDDDFNEFKTYNENEHLSHIKLSTFIKVKIPLIVPNDEFTMYLDSDTLLVKKFNSIIQYPNDNFKIGAVNNGFFGTDYWLKMYEGIFKDRHEALESFNAGVLIFWPRNLFDPKKYEELINHHWSKEYKYMDQALLNSMFWKEYFHLPSDYNFPVHNSHKLPYSEVQLPTILHFGSSFKPWLGNPRFPSHKKWFDIWNEVYLESKKVLNSKSMEGRI